MALAALVMGEVIWLVTGAIGSNSGAGAAWRIIIGGLTGMAIYFGLLLALGSPELAAVRDRLPGSRRSSSQ